MTPHTRHHRPYESVLDTIGWTPLIRLTRVTAGIRTPVYGKAEFFNPGGSVKDRIGLPIIEAAERDGSLRPGGTIVEGTSGNTGVGLAIAAALKGYRCIFTMPDKMSQEKVRLLKAFGAEVIITPTAVPPDHPDNYVMMAKRIAHETPNAILANQFYNQANPKAHYDTTGPELWEQTEGRVTHFVAAAGTGGTLTGVARYLKERNPRIRIIAGDPTGSILAELWRTKGASHGDGVPYKVEGIGQDKLPGTLDLSLIDDYRTVSDRDAFALARRLTREEGLFVGGSSGLIAHVALQVAREVDDPKAFVVTFLCDTGERYLSKLYSDEWMRENQNARLRPVVARAGAHREAGRRAGVGEYLVRRERAAGAAPDVVARCVTAASARRAQLRGVDHRIRAVGQGARERETLGCDRERGDGRTLPRRGRHAAGGRGGEAAHQGEPRDPRPDGWRALGDRDAERCPRILHGPLTVGGPSPRPVTTGRVRSARVH